MSAGEGKPSIEPILRLVLEGLENEALTDIGAKFGESAVSNLRFSTTIVGVESNEQDGEARRDRVCLANLYGFSTFLMDRECWDQAITAHDWTIRLSEDLKEPYFLGDSRFQKAFCYKKLGLRAELVREKQMITPDATCFIEGRLMGIKDLD
jgi:hypothetical protein